MGMSWKSCVKGRHQKAGACGVTDLVVSVIVYFKFPPKPLVALSHCTVFDTTPVSLSSRHDTHILKPTTRKRTMIGIAHNHCKHMTIFRAKKWAVLILPGRIGQY